MIIYGRNSLEEALSEKISISKIYVDKEKQQKYKNLIRKAQSEDIPVSRVHHSVIEEKSKSRKHQGIAGILNLPPTIIEKPEEEIDWTQYHRLIVLDGITDTGNFGSIIRSSLLFGVDAVVVPSDHSARITPQVIRASAGAVYQQNIIYIDNINHFTNIIHQAGFQTFALMPQSSNQKTVWSPENSDDDSCIYVGSERKGLRKSLKKSIQKHFVIPTNRKLDSLNASVAAAVAMYEFYRNNTINNGD